MYEFFDRMAGIVYMKNMTQDELQKKRLKKANGKRFMARLNRDVEERYVTFPMPGGRMVKGFLTVPKNKPVTQKSLLLHEIEGHKSGSNVQRVGRMYARMGIATLRIDFSGHGSRKDEWDRYSPITMVADAQKSLDWLDQEFPDIGKTVLGGFSTGGAIAVIMRAIDKRVSKTCLLYPVLSFKHNFLAAMYHDDELFVPIEYWDHATPWRKFEFTKEKLEASLNLGAVFSMFCHTYGAKFIEDCKKVIDAGQDVPVALHKEKVSPLTIVQGTDDICVPYVYAQQLFEKELECGNNIRLATMQKMNHRVPKAWEKSVMHQFKKAALTDVDDFKPGEVIVRLKSPPGFYESLGFPDPEAVQS